MSECPVCGSEYIEGEDTLCPTCGWDLNRIPASESDPLPEVYLLKEQAKVYWAKQMWEKVAGQESSLKQLEWKLANIEGQLSKVWGRFEQAVKERSHQQEQLAQIFSGFEEFSQDRITLRHQLQQEQNLRETTDKQLQTQIARVFSQLEKETEERAHLQEQLIQLSSRLDQQVDVKTLAEEVGNVSQENGRGSQSPDIEKTKLDRELAELKAKLERSEKVRFHLQDQLNEERKQAAILQTQIMELREALQNADSYTSQTEFAADITEQLIHALADPSESVQRMAYSLLKRSDSPRAKKALAGYRPYRLFKCLQVLEHQKAVRALCIHPQEHLLISGSNDKTIKIWDLHKGQLLKTLSGHAGSVIAIAISPNGELLASGSGDNTIKIWNLATGKLLSTLIGHTGWVNTVAFSPKGNTLASGGADKMIKLWNISTQDLIGTFYGHSSAVRSVAISPQGNMLVSGSNDNMIKIRNLLTGELLHTLTEHTGSVCSVAISPDGNTLTSGSNDTTVRLWNLGTGKLLHTFSNHSSAVMSVAMTHHDTLTSGSDDGTMMIWRLDTGRLLHTIPREKVRDGQQVYLLCSAIGPEGNIIASGLDDGKIKIWGVSEP